MNQNIYEKLNPKFKKICYIYKKKCSICDRKKSQIFTFQMKRGGDFVKKSKYKNGHRISSTDSAWCDLNS